MPFELAKKPIKEIDRVTKKYFFVSLISKESISMFHQFKEIEGFVGEIDVKNKHEEGIIQSFLI